MSWLGRVGYRQAAELQERLRSAVLEGSGEEALLLLEHPAVITLGRSAEESHILFDDETLARRGIERYPTSRGGDVTYHGPGQLVAYPVVCLPRGVSHYVESLAQAVLDVTRALGVSARYRHDCPGVWVGERKLCSIGIHVHRRVAIHGLALNVSTPAEAFSCIVPCGLAGVAMTSLAELLPTPPPSLEELALSLGEAIAVRLGRRARPVPASQIWARTAAHEFMTSVR